MSQSHRDPALLYREWVRFMFEQISDPVQLVLDGLDRLHSNAPSFLYIQTLAYEAPSHLRLIMLSREEPPFGLQELKVKQQAYILTNDDLAFNREETGAFFRETRKIILNPSQLSRVHSSTEGWIGGLLLFSEALEKLPEEERENYISEKLPDQIRKEAFKFFEEIILSSQAQEIREFLIKSSVLDKMETEFIGELLETKEMEEILREAARKHLFVQSNYKEGKGWVYRYHQLFRDFLQLRFNVELSPETRKSLLLKTGLLYKKRNRLEEAIPYFLQAEAYEAAISAIEKIGMDLIYSWRFSDLFQWIQPLPEELVQENPWLLYYLSMDKLFTAPLENIPIFNKAFTLFEKKGDLRGCLASLAVLIGDTILSEHALVPISVLVTKAEDLLNKVGPVLYPNERAHLWSQIGLGLILGEGDLRKAYRACQNGYLIAKETKELIFQIVGLVRGFQALITLQEISLAEEQSLEIEKLLKKQPSNMMVIENKQARGLLFLYKGDLEKAEAELEFGKKESEKVGFGYSYANLLPCLMILKMNLGHHREAEELGQHFLQLAAAQGRSASEALHQLARNSYFEGNNTKTKEYIEQILEIHLKKKLFPPGVLHHSRILRGFLWNPNEQDETVLKDLQDTLDYFMSTSDGFVIDTHFALAFVYWQKKDQNNTALHIHLGFEIARERGLAYFPYIGPRDVALICSLAIELGDQQDCDYGEKILSKRRPPQARDELERLMNHPDSNIRTRAAKISYALHRSALPILRIETLGGFRVIRSGSPVNEEEWHGSQAKNFLKAIVARGKDGVRAEALMESLWPEGQPAKVEKNFKSVLHRLRRFLEPDLDKKQGYSYVQLKDNRVFLDQEICQVDVDQFLALVQKGEQKEASRQMEEAISAYQEAADLYRGDFLPDDEYAGWADSRREELRRRYLKLLFRTARIHEERGALRKAISFYEKAVKFDPFSEEANRRLMILYANAGKHDEALHVYKTYRKLLRENLDAEPDELTRSLYKKIQKP